jgi:hypothetical protein
MVRSEKSSLQAYGCHVLARVFSEFVDTKNLSRCKDLNHRVLQDTGGESGIRTQTLFQVLENTETRPYPEYFHILIRSLLGLSILASLRRARPKQTPNRHQGGRETPRSLPKFGVFFGVYLVSVDPREPSCR